MPPKRVKDEPASDSEEEYKPEVKDEAPAPAPAPPAKAAGKTPAKKRVKKEQAVEGEDGAKKPHKRAPGPKASDKWPHELSPGWQIAPIPYTMVK